MPIRVNLPNGSVANFPDGTPPQEMERALADVQLAEPLPTLPRGFSPGVVEPPTTGSERIQAEHEQARAQGTLKNQSPFMGNPFTIAGKIPGVIGRGMTAAGKALENPLVGGAIGAAEGYRRDGAGGAVIGGVLGAGAPGVGRLARALKKTGASLSGGVAPSPPVSGGTPQSSLAREILMRDPNWRTVDAVPIDAIKRDVTRGGSIIEAGESRVGLAERLADLLKTPSASQAAEVERLAKALRQRSHIQARQSGSR